MTETPSSNPAVSPLSLFERYLSLWVLLCIIAGLTLGSLLPETFQLLAGLEYGSVNFVVAVLIWFMVYPMMVSVDFTSLKHIHKRGFGTGMWQWHLHGMFPGPCHQVDNHVHRQGGF